jgi:putative peptide maturation dehydrogenase
VPRVRRTRFLFFYAEDRGFVDVPELLRGRATTIEVQQLYAISILAGEEHPLTSGDLETLLAIPSEHWIDAEDTADLMRFARAGIVVTDKSEGPFPALLRRDEQLERGGWNLYAALYHSMIRWRDLDVELAEQIDISPESVAKLARETVAERGYPPPSFHAFDQPLEVRDLPVVHPDGDLYDVLTRRRTTRLFASTSSLAEQELATLLRYVFGCHGYFPMGAELVGLHRTSPSGGGLHPIEVYPLLIAVEGYEPGIYHYNVGQHALELLERVDVDATRDLVDSLTCGQFYLKSASALFLLTARFSRTFWKYRHERAYAVVLLDAAHLSQTFYLVCTDLGLGAFFTAAVNAANIDDLLGIDGYSEGSLAVLGCGVRSDEPSLLNPSFLPFEPRETRINGSGS